MDSVFRLRASAVSWTKFGYDEDFESHVGRLITETTIRYVTYGYEVCPTTGRKHLQGFAYSPSTQSGHFWMHQFPGCHLEKAKDVGALIVYAQKGGKFREFGTPPPGQGRRSDIDKLHTDLRGGMGMQEISNIHFGALLRYSKGIQEWYRLNSPAKMRSAPRILWLYGPTGTGKSRTTMNILKDKMADTYFLSSTHTGCWWNNYAGHKIVVMDDLRAGWMPHNQMLRVLDSTPHTVPYKGGMVALEAEVYIISTNDPPHMLYDKDPSDALARRIHDYAWVVHYEKDGPVRISDAARHDDNIFTSEFE